MGRKGNGKREETSLGIYLWSMQRKISSKEHTEYYLLRWGNLVNSPLPPNGGLDDIYLAIH